VEPTDRCPRIVSQAQLNDIAPHALRHSALTQSGDFEYVEPN
jgi:hypothetical protein